VIDEINYKLEMARFAEMISLAKLEEAKSHERVREIQFERDRFAMEALKIFAKEMQKK
jgi:hypothetical protein